MSSILLKSSTHQVLSSSAGRGCTPFSRIYAGRVPSPVCRNKPLQCSALLGGSGAVSRKNSAFRVGGARTSRRRVAVVRAVFEKFSERSIKSVMIAQSEAKNLGASEVRKPFNGSNAQRRTHMRWCTILFGRECR